jgi:hypothetical protein
MGQAYETTSQEELERLLSEGTISGAEYEQLRSAMQQKSSPTPGVKGQGQYWCFEYKSKRKLFGLPLLHVVYGPNLDPTTGRLRIAKGIIAVGGIAVGGVAIGGCAFGVVSLGGLAVGLAAMGGAAFGLGIALGGLAVGFVAMGGCAIGYYAIGGGAFGAHVLSGERQDPALKEFFGRFFPQFR